MEDDCHGNSDSIDAESPENAATDVLVTAPITTGVDSVVGSARAGVRVGVGDEDFVEMSNKGGLDFDATSSVRSFGGVEFVASEEILVSMGRPPAAVSSNAESVAAAVDTIREGALRLSLSSVAVLFLILVPWATTGTSEALETDCPWLNMTPTLVIGAVSDLDDEASTGAPDTSARMSPPSPGRPLNMRGGKTV